MRIFKFCVNESDTIEKEGCRLRPISTAIQNGELMIWVEVTRRAKMNSRIQVYSYMTGEEFEPSPNTNFLGTVQDGSFVIHVYWEELEP